MSLDKASKVVVCYAVLHNVAKHVGDVLFFEDVRNELNEDELGDTQEKKRSNKGEEKRQQMLQLIN